MALKTERERERERETETERERQRERYTDLTKTAIKLYVPVARITIRL